MESEELINILSEYNFWNKNIDTGIFREKYVNKILNLLNDIHIVTISGMRRSGKSFIAKQVIKSWINNHNKYNTLVINLDDERLTNEYKTLLDIYDAFSKLIKKDSDVLILIDEAQEIEGWEKFVRGLSERGVKFLITGSSSKLFSSEFSTLLSGRSININVMPLSFEEFLLFNNIENNEKIIFNLDKINSLLEQYIKYGGMPFLVLHPDIRNDIIKGYFDTIILKDIVSHYNIKNERELQYLITFYLTNVSSRISFNSIYKSIHIPLKTVQRYSYYIETSNLLFFINKFSFSLKEQENNPKKVYSSDNAFTTYMGFNIMENKGKMIENIIFQELFRIKGVYNFEIYYYVSLKHEIDFIIKKNNKIIPVQVVYIINEKNIKREINAFMDFNNKFKARNCIIINYNIEKIEKIDDLNIHYIKLYKFLMNPYKYLDILNEQ